LLVGLINLTVEEWTALTDHSLPHTHTQSTHDSQKGCCKMLINIAAKGFFWVGTLNNVINKLYCNNFFVAAIIHSLHNKMWFASFFISYFLFSAQ